MKSHKFRALIFWFRKFICKSLNLFKPTVNILQQNYLQPQQKKSTDLFLKQKYKVTAPSNHPLYYNNIKNKLNNKEPKDYTANCVRAYLS